MEIVIGVIIIAGLAWILIKGFNKEKPAVQTATETAKVEEVVAKVEAAPAPTVSHDMGGSYTAEPAPAKKAPAKKAPAKKAAKPKAATTATKTTKPRTKKTA